MKLLAAAVLATAQTASGPLEFGAMDLPDGAGAFVLPPASVAACRAEGGCTVITAKALQALHRAATSCSRFQKEV